VVVALFCLGLRFGAGDTLVLGLCVVVLGNRGLRGFRRLD
jgi:hypothetical protein